MTFSNCDAVQSSLVATLCLHLQDWIQYSTLNMEAEFFRNFSKFASRHVVANQTTVSPYSAVSASNRHITHYTNTPLLTEDDLNN